jgi:hypothetical protein
MGVHRSLRSYVPFLPRWLTSWRPKLNVPIPIAECTPQLQRALDYQRRVTDLLETPILRMQKQKPATAG